MGRSHASLTPDQGCLRRLLRAREVVDLKERSRAWMLLAERHPDLTDLAPPQEDEVATMVAECRFVSVLDYSQGLGRAKSLTVEVSG